MLIGAKLGFSKLIVDQIQVGRTDEGQGYDFWCQIFASSGTAADTIWGARDAVYTVARAARDRADRARRVRDALHRARVAARIRPASSSSSSASAVTIAGIVVLHVTDGIGGNWLGAAVIAAGTIVGLHGLAVWRFEPLAERGTICNSHQR